MQIQYVAGFLFRSNVVSKLTQVALIQKLKPAWQMGRLNGIGGKIEPGETPAAAMTREFEEETGAFVPYWRHFCEVHGADYLVHMFTSDEAVEVRSVEEEKVDWYDVLNIPELPTIGNLKWLIPLALDPDAIKATIIETPLRCSVNVEILSVGETYVNS